MLRSKARAEGHFLWGKKKKKAAGPDPKEATDRRVLLLVEPGTEHCAQILEKQGTGLQTPLPGERLEEAGWAGGIKRVAWSV